MTREQVRGEIGEPRVVETYGGVEFWLYPPEGSETPELLPIGFVNGRVVGWGRSYYEEALRGKIEADGSVPKGK